MLDYRCVCCLYNWSTSFMSHMFNFCRSLVSVPFHGTRAFRMVVFGDCAVVSNRMSTRSLLKADVQLNYVHQCLLRSLS